MNSTENGKESEEREGRAGTNWLRDLLPSLLPRARISTFNYVSDWRMDAPNESLRNISLKLLSNLNTMAADEPIRKSPTPLIFIGHSFGGLVIEKVSQILGRNDCRPSK